jgi:hypothetical protein
VRSVACKDGQLRGPVPPNAPVTNAVFCICHGNMHAIIRFFIMGTVTALAFTAFHTLLDIKYN